MDVTGFLASFSQSSLVKALNVPIADQYFVWLVFPLVLLAFCSYLYFVKEDKKRAAVVLLTVLLATGLSFGLKEVYKEARPCVDTFNCEQNFGFPSSHATATFALAFALIGTSVFPLALIFAVYASLMRVLTNLHSFPQIAAGMALALLVHFVLKDLNIGKLKTGKAASGETSRKVVHFLFGVAFVSIFYFLDFELAVLVSSVGVLSAILLKHALELKLINARPLGFLERKGNDFGKGAFAFAASAMFCLLFSRPLNEGLAIVAIIAAGDAASTLIGRRHGKSKFSFNNKKSVQGTVGFVIAALAAAVLFIPFNLALLFVAILSIVEVAPIELDDNLSIGIAGMILTLLI